MRGEKTDGTEMDSDIVGSSPHARGKVSPSDVQEPYPRIIPACAGKSNAQMHNTSSGKDHPRMRGEKTACGINGLGYIGSSPHARGKDKNGIDDSKQLRIIPACAGKSEYRAV